MNTKKNHTVKILPIYYDAIYEGRKTFEVRKNDRGYQSADTITLCEWDKDDNGYTGREMTFEIGFVLPLDKFCGESDYVVFSLLDIYK